jgi:hypothetical protein
MRSPIRLNVTEIRICKFLKMEKLHDLEESLESSLSTDQRNYTSISENCSKTVINLTDIPDEWKVSHMTAMHKRGDKTKCKDYHGIAVTSSVSRDYGKVLENITEQEYQDSEAEDQAGF